MRLGSYPYVWISIHAPRVGSDDCGWRNYKTGRGISIHAPRVGSDVSLFAIMLLIASFQSTLPAWGATRLRLRLC